VAVDDPVVRRSVVPPAASRSLWLAAAWTGAGAALAGAVIAIAAVALCWLPASGGSGNAGSAIRAGMLTFLAALHGGITVSGLPTQFVPLGMTIIVAAIAWRAGSGLADAAAALGEQAAGRLARAAVLQAAVFAAVCGIAAHLGTLGTSSVSTLAAGTAGLVLFGCAGGSAFVRSSPLRTVLIEHRPTWLADAARAAAAGVTVYLGAGALLVAGSLALHHGRVEALSREVGGGWGGLPVLLLGVLAAPNAAIAGAAYLAGPGFALGSGVSLGSTAHGTLPAFPILAAVPDGPAATPAWLLVAATPFVAGACVARAVSAAPTLLHRLRAAALAGGLAALLGFLLAWQGGGAIGSGALSTLGASPWQFGLATGAAIAVFAAASLAALAALAWWRGRARPLGADAVAAPVALATVPVDLDDHPVVPAADEPADPSEGDALAG
jgi:hypothetical protein